MRILSLFILAAVFVVPSGLLAAEPAAPQKAKPADAPKSEAKKPAPAKLTGRLPAYYSTVVTEEQRQEIYRVQAKHTVTIEALKAALREAVEKRDAEVEAVLSAEQRKQLAATIAAAREARRKAAQERLKQRAQSADKAAKPATDAAE